MQYHVQFTGGRVGQSRLDPFTVDVPEHLSVSTRTADLTRRIRDRVVDTLTAAPPPGVTAHDRATIAAHTQIIVQLGVGEGAAYYGTTTLGSFNLHEQG